MTLGDLQRRTGCWRVHQYGPLQRDPEPVAVLAPQRNQVPVVIVEEEEEQ